MPREVARFVDGFAHPTGVDLLDKERVERSGKVSRQPQALCATLATDDRRQAQDPLGRVDGRGHLLSLVDAIERTADTLIELGIANRDQARQ